MTIVGSVLAVVAATLGLVVGFREFTAAGRSRRIVEWTTAALDGETDSSRQQVLEQIRLRARAQLVSAHYVPPHRFAEAALWTLLGPLLVILSASKGGKGLWVVTAIGVVVLTLSFRRAIRLYALRRRVIYQFTKGGFEIEPVRTDWVALVEGRLRQEFALATSGAVIVMGIGALISWALVNDSRSPGWLYVSVSLFASWQFLQVIGKYAKMFESAGGS